LSFNMVDYSTDKVTPELVRELKGALRSVNGFGSVEIYVQNNTVTQITVRNIKKTSGLKLQHKSSTIV